MTAPDAPHPTADPAGFAPDITDDALEDKLCAALAENAELRTKVSELQKVVELAVLYLEPHCGGAIADHILHRRNRALGLGVARAEGRQP